MPLPEQELVDEDRTEGEALGGGESPAREGTVGVEGGLELRNNALDRRGTQLVEDAPDRAAVVGVRIAAVSGGDQGAVGLGAPGADVRALSCWSPSTKRNSAGRAVSSSGATSCPARRESPVRQHQQGPQWPHLGGRLAEDRQQFMHLVQTADNHGHECLEEQVVRVGQRSAAPTFRRRGQLRQTIHDGHECDKQQRLGSQRVRLHAISGLATRMM
jgi:hypothetical protein